MKIQLSDHFTYPRLIRFTLPTIVMMIVTQIYGVVDGMFVSNFAGSKAFAAINLVMPFLMCFSSVGFMIGTGGSALTAKTMGEGKHQEANEIFSLLLYFLMGFGILCTVLGIWFLKPIALKLGATEELLPYCLTYGRIFLIAEPFFMLQTTFQTFMVVAEKPNMGLWLSVLSGVINIFLDYIFICVLQMGVAGAALGTGISQVVGAVIPFLYFSRTNNSRLQLTKLVWNGKALAKSCSNGASEMMTNMSLCVVNILYNYELMQIAGADGVAAYGVIMYSTMIFSSIFFGYSIGTAPVISYHYGAANQEELRSLFRKSNWIVILSGASMTLVAEVLSGPLAKMFVGYDSDLTMMTCRAISLFSLSYLISGWNMFASSFFTALNNGFISAMISFLRTLVFQIIMILLLPKLLGLDGIWLAVVLAELLTAIVTMALYVNQNKKYHYVQRRG